jgi:hypothetical protein
MTCLALIFCAQTVLPTYFEGLGHRCLFGDINAHDDLKLSKVDLCSGCEEGLDVDHRLESMDADQYDLKLMLCSHPFVFDYKLSLCS